MLILAIFLSGLITVAAWEFFAPRRPREFPTLRRQAGNLGLLFGNTILVALIFPPLTGVWALNPVIGFIVGFLGLDLLAYGLHRAKHDIPWLWRLHAVHHSDPDVDVTTSVRHHPLDVISATAILWSVGFMLSIPSAVIVVHNVTVLALAAVTHANLPLPQWLELKLQPWLVTTDFHLVHHSIDQDEANSNFGAVLSIWDRLFGTFRRGSRALPMTFGIAGFPRRDALYPGSMLLTPWRLPR